MGAKLAGVLVLATAACFLLIAGVHQWFFHHSTQNYPGPHLASHMGQMVALANRSGGSPPDPDKILAELNKALVTAHHADEALLIFAVDSRGELAGVPIGDRDLLPPPAVLKQIAGFDQGMLELTGRGGRAVSLTYERLSGSDWVLAVASAREAPANLGQWPLFLLTALLVAVAVTLTALWWSRRFLTRPLRLLTQEAEKAAQGLVPPAALERSDELGRLSVALASLTKSAKDMVLKARQEQHRFQELFSQTKDGAFIVDEQGRLHSVNSALLNMFGAKRREELLGRECVGLLFADPEEGQLYLNSLETQGYVQDFPATMRRLGGSNFEALITATWADKGQARFGLMRDVTQLRADQMALHESEARYRRLVDNAPDMIYRYSLDRDCFDYISSAAQDITGYSVRQIMRNDPSLLKVVHPRHRDMVRAHFREAMNGRSSPVTELEFMIVDAEGRVRWLREKSILLRDELDKPLALEGIATDITEHILLEQELKRGQQMVENTLQGLPTPVMVLDRDHKVVHWNRAMEGITGYRAADMVGTNRQWEPFYLTPRSVLADLVLDEIEVESQTGKSRNEYMDISVKKSTLVDGGLEGEGFFPKLKPDGRQLYFLAAPIRDSEGNILRAVETLVDLSDKRHLEQELRRLSVTDSLTGLYNQRFFYATLPREMQTGNRYGHSFSVLMVDIDFFKTYNDRFGHLAGDRALVRFAQALRRCVREMDLPCRYGGEEFAVLLPRSTMSEALVVAERLRAEVARLDFWPGDEDSERDGQREKVRLTVSVGVATLGPDESPQEAVGRADNALYAAKQAGRNLVAADLREGGIDVLPRGSHMLTPKN
ncbi:diguanylate cyclase [Desulfoferula mesophila]|uniref:diguanylate cyclase n=1 Tax=Desulfoferula mesophila TaxID=3058419 RepID=UPI0030D08128